MMKEYSSKKKTGAFYTPSFVVDFMVDRVFYHLIRSDKINLDSFTKFKRTLTQLSFCDPSIGTGNFLLGLMKRIWGMIKNYQKVGVEEKKALLIKIIENNFFGVELDELALKACKTKIANHYPFLRNNKFTNLRVGNSLIDYDVFEIFSETEALKLKPFSWKKEFGDSCRFDVIIGNPPYFNLKKMELVDINAKLLFKYLKQSDYWKDTFRASTDIYYYFIVQALNLLENEGLLAYIIPNYWIDNKYADIIRKKILNYRILEILDFGNERVFKDNGKWINTSSCITIIQNLSSFGDITVSRNLTKKTAGKYIDSELSLEKNSFLVNQSNLGEEKWVLSPYLKILEIIENNHDLEKLGDISQVIQGVSPGVKDVFVLTESEADDLSLEKTLLVPFVTNKNIKKWVVNSDEKKVAILPSKIEKIEEYPNVFNYLLKHKKRLEQGPDRRKLITSGKIRWFDFSVYRNLDIFLKIKTKIMCPYRSLLPRFGLDRNNSFGATDVYGIVTRENEYFSLLGILNSDIIHFWYREAGKKKGRMLEFFSDPLKKVPIPKKEIREELTSIVKDMLSSLSKEDSLSKKEIVEVEETINQSVAKMYKLDHMKIKKILAQSSLTYD